jgi:hypothetical protein
MRLDAYLTNCEEIPFLNPFEMHLLLLDTAMAHWRPYLAFMAAETNEQVRTH